mmetsp:Transcript_20962/g.48021  ORF Transcript_20962/g.48021 Transcript_20962/m.48021 type:complete len:140 (-) Transcript_20962:283-702(-)
MFDPACMTHLDRLVRTSGAAIVLSSSWRQSAWGVDEVNAQLQKQGLAQVIDSTPIHGFRSRSDEILDWVHRHPDVTHFVAIDDMDLTFPHGDKFDHHFVQTDSDVGLTGELVQRALEKLNVRVDRASLPVAETKEEYMW